jgi:hypothetical protein
MTPPRLAALLVALLLTGCATPRPAGIEHAVFIWLQRPGNAKDRAQILRATEDLRRTTGLIRSVKTGTPVPSQRPVVDDSFDLALLMHFDTREKLEAFETHPAHREAREKTLRPLSRRVVIYDIALDNNSP